MDPNNPFINYYRPRVDPNSPNHPNQFLTFSNWYLQPPFFNQNSPAFDNVYKNQLEPDVDVVPEAQPDAQPATSRRRHRRKEVIEKTTKPSITRWSEVEEVALARAYIDVSEDPLARNLGNALEPSFFRQWVVTPTRQTTRFPTNGAIYNVKYLTTSGFNTTTTVKVVRMTKRS
ncbi:hypothetical protein E3N88_07013 [Mikania micrantha]|uniref:Uncharacterized protein n=1 Tax=Mikania micrantha TaxID=192012 RepID=A0A5N6PSE7_9ASTR|nr:hypothetical protein E3N88_07013 [Mikania micrantha]